VLYVLAFNLVLQGVESYLVTPMIQQREVSLPPILTIAAQLLMGGLFGIIGIMMAAPLLVVVLLMVQLLYIHDLLGDQDPGQLSRRVS
jgi:predicted PurR-regulated permease PerM